MGGGVGGAEEVKKYLEEVEATAFLADYPECSRPRP